MLHYDKIINLLNPENLSSQGCFDKIDTKLESLVLLTVSTENNLICFFCYEKWGKPNVRFNLNTNLFHRFGIESIHNKY